MAKTDSSHIHWENCVWRPYNEKESYNLNVSGRAMEPCTRSYLLVVEPTTSILDIGYREKTEVQRQVSGGLVAWCPGGPISTYQISKERSVCIVLKSRGFDGSVSWWANSDTTSMPCQQPRWHHDRAASYNTCGKRSTWRSHHLPQISDDWRSIAVLKLWGASASMGRLPDDAVSWSMVPISVSRRLSSVVLKHEGQ